MLDTGEVTEEEVIKVSLRQYNDNNNDTGKGRHKAP